MFKLFSRKSKIKELEEAVTSLTESVLYYSKRYSELKDTSLNQTVKLELLGKEVENLKATAKSIIGTQRSEKAANIVNNLVTAKSVPEAKPSAPTVQIKKTKKVKTK